MSSGEDRARTKDGARRAKRDEHRKGGKYWTEEILDGRDVGRKRRDGGGEGMAMIDGWQEQTHCEISALVCGWRIANEHVGW
jgi:hypothetical protein